MKWHRAPSVVRGDRVLTEAGILPAAVHLSDGRVTRITHVDDTDDASPLEILDVAGLIVMPGLVDTHVHINEPGRAEWEGFPTATAAAAAGGVTTVLDMPLNSIPATTSLAALEQKRERAATRCQVDVGFLGGVVPGNTKDLRALWDGGVLGFKCFLVPSGVDEFEHVGEYDLRTAMPVLAALGAPLLVHAELPGPIEQAFTALAAQDPRSYSTYLASRPPAAEVDAVRLILTLAREYGVRVHIVHVSSAEVIPLLRAARADGLPVTAESCPHYLAIEAEQVPVGATEFKCAPPIRGHANRELLWQALRDGTLDCVVSDHSPCPPSIKRRETGNYFEAWGGVASLELTLPVMWTEMRARSLPFSLLQRWMSFAPAHLAGLSGTKGRLAAGFHADFAILDPDQSFTVHPQSLHQRHPITPYAGRTLYGKVHATYSRGALVYADNEVVGEPSGTLLTRGTAS